MALLRVLVVDDSARMREIIGATVRSIGGCRIVGEAADGLEGLALARSLRPDLVVMDLSMPRMGGLEAIRALKCELPSTLVILVSTLVEPRVREEALTSGALACLEKGSELWSELRTSVEKASRLLQRADGRSTLR